MTSTAGKRHRRVGSVRLLAAAGLAPACVLLGFGSGCRRPGLGTAQGGHSSGYQVSPVTEVSTCGGYNAEVEQATAKPDYVYEAWIGCGGEGFARSTDGGLHFSNPIMLPDSMSSRSTVTDDPAIAVAPRRHAVRVVDTLRQEPRLSAGGELVRPRGTFPQVRSLIPKKNGNWADRDFIAAGRGGKVYLTWDYGPSIADVKVVCSPAGSCAYKAVDATAVVQKSTDSGKTWGPITTMQPGFPAGGGYDGSVLVQPNGNSPQGYATYLRPFSITRAWLAPVLQVSPQFGNVKDWPGDTFGLSASGPKRVALSWGSAVGTSQNSEIYESVVRLP